MGGVSKSSPVPREEAEGIPMRRVRSLGLVLSDSVTEQSRTIEVG